MNKVRLSAAVAALVVVMAVSSAQAQQPKISASEPLAPAPGTIVKVGSMNCLMTNAQDTTAWCENYGKTILPACTNPVVVDRVLQCADGFARRK